MFNICIPHTHLIEEACGYFLKKWDGFTAEWTPNRSKALAFELDEAFKVTAGWVWKPEIVPVKEVLGYRIKDNKTGAYFVAFGKGFVQRYASHRWTFPDLARIVMAEYKRQNSKSDLSLVTIYAKAKS